MATIAARKRKDGTTGYTAQVLIKQKGVIVFREAKTFDNPREAKAWAGWKETEMRKPGALDAAAVQTTTLADAVDKYLAAHRHIGRTKEQVLRSIKTYDIAKMRCDTIRSPQIVAFAEELAAGDRKPQTVMNYMSHLQAVFREAKPGFDIPLDYDQMRAAMIVLNKRGTTTKSAKRDRRPTLPEIDTLMAHFADRQVRAPHSVPMCKVIAFALFSTRRQEEITRIQWVDLDEAHKRILVRDLKHPGQKIGNNVWCDLPDEALRIIKTMPRTKAEIFPFGTDAISAGFTRACQFLGIEDLRFHDLRHEGVSRLFEMGWNIPHVAAVSGHRSWASLQRYAHLRQTGDKFANWPWLERICQ